MTSMLQTLERHLVKYGFLSIDLDEANAWPKSIAGFTHLPKAQQLVGWAESNGYVTRLDRGTNLLHISSAASLN